MAGLGVLTPALAIPGALPRNGGAPLELFESPNANPVLEEDGPALPEPRGSLLLLAELVLAPLLLDPNTKGADVEVPLPVAPRAGGKATPLAFPKLWLELSPDA